MERFTNEELLEVLPVALRETKELTSKQKVVLAQLSVYNGLNQKDSEGFFFRSNKDLAADCGIEEKTVITAIRKLVMLGLIVTKRGSRRTGASYYKVLEDKLNDYCKNNTVNYSDNYSNNIAGIADRIKELEITVKNLNKNYSKDYSTDIEKDIEIDKELDIIIYNILKYINKKTLINKLNSILEESVREKELEEKEAEVAMQESQSVEEETIPEQDTTTASTPVENESQVTPAVTSTDEEHTPAEEQPIPIEEEIYKGWIQHLEPLLTEYDNTSSVSELDGLKDKTVRSMQEYRTVHQIGNEGIQWKVAGVIAERYSTHKFRIESKNNKMLKMFQFQSQQLN